MAAAQGSALPWRDPAAFAELMPCREMRSHHLARRHPGLVFFDRGLPDVVGYLRLLGLPCRGTWRGRPPPSATTAASSSPPPWPDIFRQDHGRKQGFGEAVRTHQAMLQAYTACGCDLVELPRVPVEAAVRVVSDRVGPPA